MPTNPPLISPLRPVARLLPPEEWAAKTPDFAHLSPEHGLVVVVEDGGAGGAILAQWASFTVVHVEGLQVAPEARGHAGVGRALLSFMAEQLASHGVQEVLTQAETPEVATLIRHAGGKAVPGETYVIPLAPRGASDPLDPSGIIQP